MQISRLLVCADLCPSALPTDDMATFSVGAETNLKLEIELHKWPGTRPSVLRIAKTRDRLSYLPSPPPTRLTLYTRHELHQEVGSR